MILCIRITFSIGEHKGFLRNFVLKHANKLEVAGTAQIADGDMVKIIACGQKENIDAFVDSLYQGSVKYHLDNISLEPFPKGKDFRGVFRVLE